MSLLFIFPHYYVMKMMKIALILQNVTNFPFNESVCMKLKNVINNSQFIMFRVVGFQKIAKLSFTQLQL